MCSLSKEQFILSGETIQNAVFFKIICPFSTNDFFVITEDIDLKQIGYVPYLKSNSYYLGREFKMQFFFRIMPLFRHFILYQAPHSQALAPACGSLVLVRVIVVTTAFQCICMCTCLRPSRFVQTITSIFMDRCQNSLAQLSSLTLYLICQF